MQHLITEQGRFKDVPFFFKKKSFNRTYLLVEGEVDSPAVAVKHEVGVSEQLGVAFLKGDSGEVGQLREESSLMGREQNRTQK